MVLEAAVNGGAACVVSWNARHLKTVSTEFGIPILSPQAALLQWMP
jgi:hypothetical protein